MDPSTEKHTEANSSGLQRDAFLDSIESYEVTSIPLELPPGGETSIKVAIAASGLFLVGETHGQQATPNALYTLAKQFNFKQLALEWSTALQPVVDEFLSTGNLRSDIPIDTSDGRITAGHFAVMAQLKKEGLITHFHCVVPATLFGPNDYDAGMAQNIESNIDPQKPLLIAVGNRHTETIPRIIEEPYYGAGTINIPLGAHLKSLRPETGFGLLHYSSESVPSLDTPAFIPASGSAFTTAGESDEHRPVSISVVNRGTVKNFGLIEG